MTRPRSAAYTGPGVTQYAQRKARYGHRNWLAWTGPDGQRTCAPATAGTVKTAMLAHGTQGDDITLIHANCGTLSVINWPLAVTLWRNLRHAERGR